MKSIRALPALFAILLFANAAHADAITFVDNSTVSGKVTKINADKVTIHVGTKDVEYGKNLVKKVVIAVKGPGAKVTAKEIQFSDAPENMPFQVETEHYLVMTDTTESACRNAANAMEAFYKAFTEMFKPANVPNVKTNIIIWEKAESFTAYTKAKKLDLAASTVGVFVRTGNDWKILAYKRQDEFNTLSILYHEGTHQFIQMVMGKVEPPLWMNEGLAVYFENSFWENGKLRTGIIPKTRLLNVQQTMGKSKEIPLADLFLRRGDTFDPLCYGESWSFIYFLVKANNGAYASHFMTYFNMVRDGKDPKTSFEKTISPDMDKVQQAWKKFTLELKAPVK